MAFTDFAEPLLLNKVIRAQNFTITGTSKYVGLFTVAPSDAGGGTEVSGGGYARQQVFNTSTGGSPAWTSAAASGALYFVTNSGDITFPQATATWGTIVACAVIDSLTSTGTNNYIMHGSLTANKTVNNGDQFKFASGNLRLKVG